MFVFRGRSSSVFYRKDSNDFYVYLALWPSGNFRSIFLTENEYSVRDYAAFFSPIETRAKYLLFYVS